MSKFFASVVAVAAAALLAGPATAQTGGAMVGTAPGKAGAIQTVKATATITAIDKATRDITLKGPQGNMMTVTAGPDVKNFDALKVGDQVDMQYVEALTLELKKGGGMVVGRTEKADAVGREEGRDAGWRSRPSGHHCRRRSGRGCGQADGDAQGTEGNRRPAHPGRGAVQAHRQGRPGRSEVHPGVRRVGGARQEVMRE